MDVGKEKERILDIVTTFKATIKHRIETHNRVATFRIDVADLELITRILEEYIQ